MKEIRTFVGATLEQLNALFAAVEEITRLFSPGDKITGSNPHWVYYSGISSSGDPCVASMSRDQVSVPTIAIRSVQLKGEDSFVIKIVIEESSKNEVLYAKSEAELLTVESGLLTRPPHARMNGVLHFWPLIRSHIDRAMDPNHGLQPLYILRKTQ